MYDEKSIQMRAKIVYRAKTQTNIVCGDHIGHLFELINNNINFKVNVTKLDNITASHIHLGEFGQNGEIIVSLLKASTPLNILNGTLVEGKVTAADLEGSLKGKTINDLVKLFNDTKTYVNIHTKQNPNGEIRGEITIVNGTNWWN